MLGSAAIERSMTIQASSRKGSAAATAAGAAAVVHKRCFSASALANIYGAFRCKQLHPGAVVIPAPVRAAAPAEFNIAEGSPPPLLDRFCGGGGAAAELKAAALARLQALVRDLQSSDPEKRLAAASGVRGAARREGGARTTLAMMGAIPPLVAMLDPSSPASACAALLALLNLAVRNDENKAAIVRTGAATKILRLLATTGGAADNALQSAAAGALLTLTALDANKPAIGALPGAVAALSGIATSASFAARRDALGALYNLSICSSNTVALVSGGAVSSILAALSSGEPPPLTRRAVATAFNLATTHLGRQALASTPSSSLVFIDLLASSTSPSSPWSPCRGQHQHQHQQVAEQAAFVVMALAECSPAQRRAMSRGGAASSLLEAVLLGSPATQERASRSLDLLRIDDDLMVQDPSCDESLHYQLDMDDEQRLELVSDERRAVDALVQQSLKMNMERIVRRASCDRSTLPQLVD